MNNYRKTARLGITLMLTLFASTLLAASAAEIDREANKALDVFREDIDGAQVFLDQTGEGVLRVGGQTVAYYRTTSGSIGLQLGAQAKSIVIAFMTPASLKKFRDSEGWKVGVDGSVALIDLGGGKTIDSDNVKDPVVGFIFGSKGLMYNLTLEGSKFTKLDKS